MSAAKHVTAPMETESRGTLGPACSRAWIPQLIRELQTVTEIWAITFPWAQQSHSATSPGACSCTHAWYGREPSRKCLKLAVKPPSNASNYLIVDGRMLFGSRRKDASPLVPVTPSWDTGRHPVRHLPMGWQVNRFYFVPDWESLWWSLPGGAHGCWPIVLSPVWWSEICFYHFFVLL